MHYSLHTSGSQHAGASINRLSKLIIRMESPCSYIDAKDVYNQWVNCRETPGDDVP